MALVVGLDIHVASFPERMLFSLGKINRDQLIFCLQILTISQFFFDLLSYKGNLHDLYACSHE